MARRTDLGFTALKVEGGLLPPEFLRTVADLQAGDQDGASYGLTRSLNLRDEIGRHWRIACDLWADYRTRRTASGPELGRATVDRWLAPLLTQALGFSDLQPTDGPIAQGERVFPLTHSAARGVVPLVLLPLDFELDKAYARCGEEGRRRTLNASEDRLWGVVSNGLVLRILRDNPSLTRPAWIEFDLERAFEAEVFSDFAAFWLLAHGSRFPPREAGRPASCILERWRAKAHESGERARAQLRKGVETALRTLGNGFVRHPANDALRRALQNGGLKPADLHQQLLRLVYRCLFLLTVEDRELLHPPGTSDEAKRLWREGYSLGQLRERALRPAAFDGFSDLWQGLAIAFTALHQGAPEIGAPALDSALFDWTETPDLHGAQLANRDLLGAIKALSFFTPAKSKSLARINYRDMNTEEFGSVYEGLLELHPHVDAELWKFGYVGLNGDSAKGSERKLSGSYYTPSSLVQELIRSALEPVMIRAMTDHPYDRRAALLGLKVIDPACGSGHFLLAAARKIAASVAEIEAAPDAPTEAQRQHALREVVRHCIYGVDKNPLAVELCKTALWIETVEPGRPLSFLDHRIRVGDSLIGVFDLSVLEEGIPEAAYAAKTGDDKAVARDLKKRNKEESRGQQTLGLSPPQIEAVRIELAKAGHALEAQGEDDAGAVAHKARLFERLHGTDGWRRLKDACDLWTAAFFARLEKPAPGHPERIPTTDAVRKALAGPTPQALTALLLDLEDQHFFHWPIEFPEVFDPSRPNAEHGFDVVLGNPPWEVSQLNDKEYFGLRAPQIARLEGARRKAAIASLRSEMPQLWRDYQAKTRNLEVFALCMRGTRRFHMAAVGKLNSYALFCELSVKLLTVHGHLGMIVQSGIMTDSTNRILFQMLLREQRIVSAYDMVNTEGIFPGIHRSHPHFCLLTVAGYVRQSASSVSFYNTNTDHLRDQRRQFQLHIDDILLFNPNTQTCPILRSSSDATLSRKIYSQWPVLVKEVGSARENPWGFSAVQNFFSHTTDGRMFVERDDVCFRAKDGSYKRQFGEAKLFPLYEGKMVDQYDHRFGSFFERGSERGNRVLPESTLAERQDPEYEPTPHFWVEKEHVLERALSKGWHRTWLIVWKDITTAITDRTTNAAIIPLSATDDTLSIATIMEHNIAIALCLLANFNFLVFDYTARQKVSGLHIRRNVFIQLPALPPETYMEWDIEFIQSRVLELSYTSTSLKGLALDFGYEGPPFGWNEDRRGRLRAELDAYYAWLYGLTRDELRYILDPKEVMGEDFPSETFRVLKEREIKEHGEYRTRRLVLEAFDRFHEDGTFDAARVRDPHYFETITRQLATATTELQLTRVELEETKRTLAALLSKADRDERPTLFVEGEDDARIVAAAWSVFSPGEPMPFKVVSAGGTTQMRPLAVAGKALRPVIGDRLLLALADNDSEGRDLWREGKLHQGGKWMPQTNGVWWCLLVPSDEFRDVMTSFKIDPAFWPFTIENAFPASLRRQALAEGAYAHAKVPQADLLKEQRISTRVLEALADLSEDDPAVFYLRRPTPEAKDAFAAWITDPARLTRESYAAFEPIFAGLKLVIAQHQAKQAAADPPRQARLM